MNLQCRTCWTVFDASLAERVNTDFSNRVLVCPPCADTFNQVIPREEWTPAEVEEVTEEAPAPARKLRKIDFAKIVAEHTPLSQAKRRKPQTPEVIERRAADIAKRYSLPLLRAWAASYVSATAEERQTAAEAMRAEEPNSLLGPAPRARLRAEVGGILRRAAERSDQA